MQMRLIGLACGALICAADSFAWTQESAAARASLRLNPEVFVELKKNALPAWDEIERRLDSIDVDHHKTYSEYRDGELLEQPEQLKYRVAWNRQKGLALLRRSGYAEYPDGMYHVVANRSYSFEVWVSDKQFKGEIRGATLFNDNQDPANRESELPRAFDEHMRDACAACRFISMPLRVLVESPEFESVEAVEEREKGERRIRYSARYLGEQGNSRRKGGVYTILVAPAANYRFLHGRISYPERADEETIEVTYQESRDVFVPKTYRWILRRPDEKYVADQLAEFELPRKCEIPEEEFRLEHYGFDESVLVPVSPHRWLRWLLMAVGAASLVLGYWLLARRKVKG